MAVIEGDYGKDTLAEKERMTDRQTDTDIKTAITVDRQRR